MMQTLQIRSNGKLASTITVQQTGPMQLTFRAGTYTDTDGNALVLASDQVVDLATPAVESILMARVGRLNGVVSIKTELWPTDGSVRSQLQGVAMPDGTEIGVDHGAYTVNWDLMPNGETLIPAGTADLTNVPVKVIEVLV